MTFKLYAILRSYNTKRVIDLLHRLSLSTTPLDSVTVIIDIERDAINTPGLLKDITCPFPIHVIPLDHYGWSKALNTAILSLPEVDTRTDEYIMPISNEVLIESNQIQMLLRAAGKKRASCGYALFKGRFESSYCVPRNTCAIWKRSLFSNIGLFNERLDNSGGMEDYEMVLRAFRHLELFPFPLEKRIGLVMREPNSFQQKIAMENQAIQTIEASYPKQVVITVKEHLKALHHECE